MYSKKTATTINNNIAIYNVALFYFKIINIVLNKYSYFYTLNIAVLLLVAMTVFFLPNTSE